MTYISLGGNCCITYQLKKLDIESGYPFDWCKTKINQLNLVLENNFENYHFLKLVKFSENHFNINNINSGSFIFKNNYKITFAHEIFRKYEKKFFEEKLLNRIKKFKQIKNPIFIRLENQNLSQKYFKEQYIKLINNLQKYFDNFKLILISKNEPFDNNKIMFYQLKEFSNDWKYNYLNWNEIIKLY